MISVHDKMPTPSTMVKVVEKGTLVSVEGYYCPIFKQFLHNGRFIAVTYWDYKTQ